MFGEEALFLDWLRQMARLLEGRRRESMWIGHDGIVRVVDTYQTFVAMAELEEHLDALKKMIAADERARRDADG